MSATVDTNTDWQNEVLDLKRQGLTSAQIAEAVGKHAATVRKVIARANDADPPIAGQTTVDEHLAGDVPPEDDPEFEPVDPLDEFRAEAGEPVGPMPPAAPLADPEPVDTRVRGTRQTCIDFGPEADIPTGGTLVVKSEKLASGHFRPGDLVTGTFTARITDFGHKERFDKASEEFRAKPVAYVATMTEIVWDVE